MSNFIELRKARSDETAFVSMKYCIKMEKYDYPLPNVGPQRGTNLYFLGGELVAVKETPQEILEILKKDQD